MNSKQILDKITSNKGEVYEPGFVTNIETFRPTKGLNSDTIKFISKKKMNHSGCWNGG